MNQFCLKSKSTYLSCSHHTDKENLFDKKTIKGMHITSAADKSSQIYTTKNAFLVMLDNNFSIVSSLKTIFEI